MITSGMSGMSAYISCNLQGIKQYFLLQSLHFSNAIFPPFKYLAHFRDPKQRLESCNNDPRISKQSEKFSTVCITAGLLKRIHRSIKYFWYHSSNQFSPWVEVPSDRSSLQCDPLGISDITASIFTPHETSMSLPWAFLESPRCPTSVDSSAPLLTVYLCRLCRRRWGNLLLTFWKKFFSHFSRKKGIWYHRLRSLFLTGFW